MSKSIQGRRYINLLRVSTNDQDIADQRTANDAFAREHGMLHASVEDQEAEGVSGSQTFNREDISSLISKKKDGGDFDVVLIHDLSRLTRGGVGHGHDVKRRLAGVGVDVISVGDNLPEGDEADLIESVVHYKNRLYSKNLSAATTRGRYSGLKNNRFPGSSTTPYGFDRLYTTAGGTPTLILRNLGGGTKVKLDPVTKAVRGTISKDASGKSPKFIKQRDEISKLVPGDPARVQVVQDMFRDHYVNDVGIARIALDLNRRCVPAPAVQSWSLRTVHAMLRNTVYLGHPVSGRTGRGGFHEMSPERPTPVTVNQALLEEKGMKSLPPRKRPTSAWFEPQPAEGDTHAALITDPEVLRKAEARMAEYWARWADGTTAEADRDRHNTSKYFLKKLLHSKQGNHSMCGRTTGGPEGTRYYRIRHTEAFEEAGSVLRRQIPAGPVERAALDILVQTLSSPTEIGPLIDTHIKKEIATTITNPARRHELQEEERKLARRLKLIYETADEGDDNDDTDLKETISNIKLRRREVQQALLALDKSERAGAIDISAVRQSVLRQFAEVVERVGQLPMLQLRRLAGALFSNLTIDLETRELEIEVRLPSWAMSSAAAIHDALGLQLHPVEKASYDAHPVNELKIAKFRCEHHRETKKQPICYRCSRVSTAASTSPSARAA